MDAMNHRTRTGEGGFVLALTIILVLGVTAISVGTMYSGRLGKMSSYNYRHKIQTFSAADGLVTLLAQEIINGNGKKYIDTTRVGTLFGQVWTGLPGNTYATLKSAIMATPTPSYTISSYYLGANLGLDNYGIKWTGYLIPPLSGSYTFYTRSDDGSAFYLSTDASAANLSASPLCYLNNWVYRWPTSGTGVSRPITLIGGNRYYFEYYHKQGGGGDIGQMGWDGPEYFSERPITGKYLSQYESEPAWAGTIKVGTLPVRYQVLGAGLDKYRIFTEAVTIRAGRTADTVFRTPLVQSISLKGNPVKPPAKLWLRVIHYDYSSTTNPEFNMSGFVSGVMKDMVIRKFVDYTATDAAFFGRTTIPKPTRNRITPNRNCNLNLWFKDWVAVHNVPKYADPGNCTDTYWDVAGDKWRNRKVYDSLEFTLDVSQGPNTYVFSQMGNFDTGSPETSWRGDSSEYFPIDRLGDEPAGSGHNYSFCTELHTTFIHQSGLKFEFTGDDDTWGYVNDSLVIDLGGPHVAKSAFVNLDDLAGLRFGQIYNFDFFQCERHMTHSGSRIVTNIKMLPPQGKPVANWRREYGSLD